MRSTILRLALLGAAAALPAYAQTSPATPDRNPPTAATENSTRPGMTAPAPGVAPSATTPSADRSGATTPNTGTERSQRAVTTDDGTRTANAPVPGANSFTEGQARSRIEAAGFSGVGELRKDDQGIWRGQAQRGGQSVGVALDYQGNVSTQ
ncbi:hypothetical protein [Siccirubricoccus sp. G192]|uniref:hypothetical protein n=1 Tax=Siccirubricoccus sp. G192 TaxID=2849651 RepID=UPI001C2C7C64|nr:hypothetical protein [Siccirubricoccus sp. G192]MBV1797719.1 hypothetical protein [Siccirubricoccus sp. G192]